MASLAGPSMMLLRGTRPSLSACSSLAASCSYTFSTSAALEQRSKKNSQRKRSPPKGPKNTPPGTNKKPDPPGRPKRYDTTYGIPPLHPAMYRKGANKLNREAEEKAQRPDFETLWRLQEEASASTSKNEVAEKRKQIAELRANQPRRHPLWAFFREVTKRDVEDMQHFKPVEKGPDGEEKPYPGYYALGTSVLRPNKDLDTSGRAWEVEELRRKSFDDLHTLWYLLVVERNLLHTSIDDAKRQRADLRQSTWVGEQLTHCRKSMARIKQVLSERRHAVKEAQQLVLAAQEAAEQSGDATGTAPAQSQQSFMEEEAPAKSTTAPMST